MATETVIQATNPPGESRHVEALRQRALRILDELVEEEGKAFAVAAAGRSHVDKDAVTERHLFETIEDILGDATLTNMLRDVINELAAARAT
jgi:hypothetical protein